MSSVILQTEHLTKTFPVKGGLLRGKRVVHALNDVSISIHAGETLGLVGESGCGKSTLGKTILKIHEPDSGRILFDGVDITAFDRKQMQSYRQRMQMVFQDPYASLNPRATVGQIIQEPMDIFGRYPKEERTDRVRELLATVGLKPDHISRYPHEFSGGQRQRIGIARMLALDPAFVVCDEPISALDVSIQAQIINLLERLQKERGMSYLFIAHDLGMVRHISHRIGVMYLGSLVEVGEADEIYDHPMHPYTQVLISAVPVPDPRIARAKQSIQLKGEVPNPLDIPQGCPFCSRCPIATDECRRCKPELMEQNGRLIACHHVRQL